MKQLSNHWFFYGMIVPDLTGFFHFYYQITKKILVGFTSPIVFIPDTLAITPLISLFWHKNGKP